ncbi:MAG: hypothetical protein H0Z24_00275 [Thermosipho sp. (in: Bacteria)]|nr:hypothetical protein [Thermosipho sp. (in: thermotogales)]
MEKIIEIIKELFKPVEIYKSDNLITVILNTETDMEEKLSKFSKQISSIDEDLSLRFLTIEEKNKFDLNELGVKIF